MKTSEQIRRIADEMESELKAHEMPDANPQLIGRLRFLRSPLGALDTYASEKAGDLTAKAEIFYSARKHWDYPGGTALLRAQMFALLDRIRGVADTRERNGG